MFGVVSQCGVFGLAAQSMSVIQATQRLLGASHT
jgi:hypothetical protein